MAWGNDYRNIVCPHCGRRIGDANGMSTFGGGFGGFGGIRGIDAPSRRGGSLNYGEEQSSRNPSVTNNGGAIRMRPWRGPEKSAGPRTTSYGTGNGRFGELYRIDEYGRKRYL